MKLLVTWGNWCKTFMLRKTLIFRIFTIIHINPRKGLSALHSAVMRSCNESEKVTLLRVRAPEHISWRLIYQVWIYHRHGFGIWEFFRAMRLKSLILGPVARKGKFEIAEGITCSLFSQCLLTACPSSAPSFRLMRSAWEALDARAALFN